MIASAAPGQLFIGNDALAVAREASRRVAAALRAALGARGSAALALSGGETPRGTYAQLTCEADVNWSMVEFFWADERAVPASHARSNYRLAKATLLDGAHVPADRVHRIPAEECDGEAVAREYECTLRARVPTDEDGIPALDVVILGIGEDGHTASLFPGDDRAAITDRLVVYVPASGTREARVTMTAPILEHARQVYVLVLGANKRAALQRVWSEEGSVRETPARVLRHSRGLVTWMVDRDATGGSA